MKLEPSMNQRSCLLMYKDALEKGENIKNGAITVEGITDLII